MVDVLDYLIPDPAFMATSHLAVAGGGQPNYVFWDQANSRIWNIKGAGGFSWDSFDYDANFIYQRVTENVWTSPSTFKCFASKSTPNGGILWMQRLINESGFNAPLVTADSSYRTYSSCAQFATATLGGSVMTQVEMLEAVAFGGSVGTMPALLQKYFWGPNFANLECNYYVKGMGLVQWQLWVPGASTPKQVSLFNTQVAGGTPPLVFPCAMPTI